MQAFHALQKDADGDRDREIPHFVRDDPQLEHDSTYSYEHV